MKNFSKETTIQKASLLMEKESKLIERDFDYASQAYSSVLGYGKISESELESIVGNKVSKRDILY